MSVLPYDYQADLPIAGSSLAELAPLISDLREGETACCLFDTGDFLQGNALADYLIKHGSGTDVHPMVSAMNTLDYDAIALGNHEFDYGTTALLRVLEQLDCPALLANVTDKDAKPFFTPATLIKRQVKADDGLYYPVNLGVVGLVTPSAVIARTAADPLHLTVSDMTPAASDHARALKRKGADIVIALCHAGLSDHPDFETAAQVAASPDIDVILGGHVHDTFPRKDGTNTPDLNHTQGTLAGKPAVMAGAFGRNLGVIDLRLHRRDDRWCIADHVTKVLPAPPYDQATAGAGGRQAAIRDMVQANHEQTLTTIRQPVATTTVPINSFFSQIYADHSLQLLADSVRAAMQSALRQTACSDLPMLVAVPAFCTGTHSGPGHFVDIPCGPITRRAARALVPFDNALVIARQSGADILARLERASGQFLTVAGHCRDQMLCNPQVPPYSADTIFGVTYCVDLSKPAGQGRISDLRAGGKPVGDDDVFMLGMSTHRAFGGGGYDRIRPADIIHQSPHAVHDHLLSYLRDHETVSPRLEHVWRFAPITGASAVFLTSPQATADVAPPDLQLSHRGTNEDGFAVYDLSFDPS